MILFNSKGDCCGCSMCQNECKQNAIMMYEDIEGFRYPGINESLCIECSLCKQKCIFQNGNQKLENLEAPTLYAAINKNSDIRNNSRSGGIFTALSDYILEQGGIIIGAAFRKDFSVVHKIAHNKKERDQFRGSKYVQSDIESVIGEMKEKLEMKTLVLFSGTPCQVAAVKSYFNNNKYLYTCDIICHGTPSPKIWSDYIRYIKYKHRQEITEIEFRNKKEFGWYAHYESFKLEHKTIYSNLYSTLFCKNDILRPSCYKCKYTSFYRPSEITLGDFWGIEKVAPDLFDNKGTSLLFINNSSGKELFNKIKDCLEYRQVLQKDCEQPNLKSPTKEPYSRVEFWEDYLKFGISYILKKYGKKSPINSIKTTLNRIKYKIKEKI